MRLLFLNHNNRFGGTYYRAMPMAEKLAARGHAVTLMTVSREHRFRSVWSNANGVDLCETPGWLQENSGQGYGPLDNAHRMVHALVHRYDIIHMFDHRPNATFPGLFGRLRGARLVADWADWWAGPGGLNDVPKRRCVAIGRFDSWWEERSKRWADGVVAISTVLQRRAIDLGCEADRVVYLPTGAAVDRIRKMPVGEARQRLNVPADRRIVGFIGMGQGDLEIVMDAMRDMPGVWLMVVGYKNPRVLRLAEEARLGERLWQTGFVPDEDVSTYLGCADVFAMPMSDKASNRGRLPNKLLDYMCAGRPTVASPVGDVEAIVRDHGVGLLAGPNEFAGAVRRLLDDDTLRSEMGERARRVAGTEFGWSRLIDRLEAFYGRVLGMSKLE